MDFHISFTISWSLLNGHESEQTPGCSEGQGSLVCCSPWGLKKSDMTEQLNIKKHACRFLYTCIFY